MRTLMIVMNFLNQNSGAFSVVFSCIVAAGTIIYACLTWKIIVESRRTRKIQTVPKLHIDAEPKGSMLNLVIWNIGVPPARNVKIVRVNPPIDYFEIAKERHTVNEKAIIEDGKSVLYSGEKITIPLLSANDKHFQEEIKETLEIEVSFLDMDGRKHTEKRRINLERFKDILIAGRESEKAFFI